MAYSVNTTPLLQECDSENEDIQNEVHIKDNKPLFKPLEPKDRYFMTYIIFYLLGVVTLLPWNFFVTADDYWMYKFRDVNSNSTVINGSKRTPLQAELTSYISVASAFPNLIFLILNSALSHRVSLNKRVIGSLVMTLILFLSTLVFVNIDTDKWQHIFFMITMITVVLLNVCSAVLSGSIFGVMGKFTPIYITAVIGGQALGGIFASLTQIASLAIGASSVHTAFVYFSIGNVTILISIISYIVMAKGLFFKFYVYEKRNEIDEFQSTSSSHDVISYKDIFKKVWCYGLSMFIVFAVTLAVYPGVTVLIESEGKGPGHTWNNVYFVPTINYLLFNIGDYSGRLIAGRIQKPKGGLIIIILSISRLVFIPLLMLCNAHPRHNLAVVFDKDYQYIIISFLCAVSNGYLTNISSISAPRVVEQHEKEVASLIVTVFMGFGLALGSILSLVMVKLL